MNKTIMTNDEWAVGFMEQLDSMLDGIESITEKAGLHSVMNAS